MVHVKKTEESISISPVFFSDGWCQVRTFSEKHWIRTIFIICTLKNIDPLFVWFIRLLKLNICCIYVGGFIKIYCSNNLQKAFLTFPSKSTKSQIKKKKVTSSSRLSFLSATQGGISSEDTCNCDLTLRQSCCSMRKTSLMALSVPCVQPDRFQSQMTRWKLKCSYQIPPEIFRI